MTRMRWGARWGTAVLAAVLGLSLVTPTNADALDRVSTRALQKAVTVNGILTHERALQRIANANNGTRASGTPGYRASADYVAATLKKSGYRVTRQTFTFPFYREVAPAQAGMTFPFRQDFETRTLDYSGSGDVNGRVIFPHTINLPNNPGGTDSGCTSDDFTPAASDSPQVALIQRGGCTFEQKAANAQANGYDAVIIFNTGGTDREDVFEGTLNRPFTIPVVSLSYAEGRLLFDYAKENASARVVTSTENDPNRQTTNIIADSPKGKHRGETVVIGAHLDSVVEGPGINDNGSGAATVLEIARQMAALKLNGKLQRQVRFAFWGAEEFGLLGSTHYVDSLSDDQLAQVYANLNFDMLGSPNYVRFVYDGDGSSDGVAGPPGSGAIEQVFTDYFAGRGLASEPTAFDGRSDYGPFIDAGIPAGGLFSGAEGIKTPAEAVTYGGTAGAPYDSCYHQDCDTISNLSQQALYELGDAAAHATAVLALSRRGLYPDGSLAARAQHPERARSTTTDHGHAPTR